MKILPYKIDTTDDLSTSRAGLLSIAELIRSMQLDDIVTSGMDFILDRGVLSFPLGGNFSRFLIYSNFIF